MQLVFGLPQAVGSALHADVASFGQRERCAAKGAQGDDKQHCTQSRARKFFLAASKKQLIQKQLRTRAQWDKQWRPDCVTLCGHRQV